MTLEPSHRTSEGRPRRLGWRRRLWRMLTRGLYVSVVIDAGVLALAVALGGRPIANAHPQIRGGGGAWADSETFETHGKREP